MHSFKGYFIAVEGVDAVGKSTMVKDLVERLKTHYPDREVVLLREPGGESVAEKIRSILLNDDPCTLTEEILLYTVSRMRVNRKIIQPALERGAIVVADRYYPSTYCYQLGTSKKSNAWMLRTIMMEFLGVEITEPDVFLYLTASPEVLDQRRANRDGKKDNIEARSESYLRMVRDNYEYLFRGKNPPENPLSPSSIDLIPKFPMEQVHVIDTSKFNDNPTTQVVYTALLASFLDLVEDRMRTKAYREHTRAVIAEVSCEDEQVCQTENS